MGKKPKKVTLPNTFAYRSQLRFIQDAVIKFNSWISTASDDCAVARENALRLARLYALVAMHHKRFIRFMLTESRKPNHLLYPAHRRLCPDCPDISWCLNDVEKKYVGGE